MQEIFVKPSEQRSNFGFALWRSRPRIMAGFHHHNDVEVNLLLSGGLQYLHGGGVWPLTAGQLAIFWAARPHQVVELEKGTRYYGLSVPLAWFKQWQLPDALVLPILQGDALVAADPAHAEALCARMESWITDLQCGDLARRRVLLLELQAWFHRLGLGLQAHAPQGGHTRPSAEGGLDKVEAIARYITAHYTEPLTVAEVAEEIGLHPNYAVQLFRKKTGITLVDFIAQQRIAHAQLLLTTTEKPVIDIAFESGFGSASRFYALFKERHGMSPRAYRKAMRQGDMAALA